MIRLVSFALAAALSLGATAVWAMSPEADGLLAGALAALEAGSVDTALALATEAVAVDPTALHAQLLRGSLQRERGDLNGAMASFEAAVVADPTHVGALMELATTEAWLGYFELALTHYRSASALAPNDPEPTVALARTLSWAGRHTEAAATLDQVTAEHPRHVGALVTAARVEAARSRPEAARTLFEAAIALDPENSDAEAGLSGLSELRPRAVAFATDVRRTDDGATAMGWNVGGSARTGSTTLRASYGMLVPDLKPESDGSVQTTGIHTGRLGFSYRLSDRFTFGATTSVAVEPVERHARVSLETATALSGRTTALLTVTPGYRTDGGADLGGNAGVTVRATESLALTALVFAYQDFDERSALVGAGRVSVERAGWLAQASVSAGRDNGVLLTGFGARLGRSWRRGGDIALGYDHTQTFFTRHTVSLTLRQAF